MQIAITLLGVFSAALIALVLWLAKESLPAAKRLLSFAGKIVLWAWTYQVGAVITGVLIKSSIQDKLVSAGESNAATIAVEQADSILAINLPFLTFMTGIGLVILLAPAALESAVHADVHRKADR